MKIPVYEVVVGESIPALQIWLSVDGVLLSGASYTYSLTVRDDDNENDLFVKTSGFVGQTGSGNESSGTPNVVIAWESSGELDQLTAGRSHHACLSYTRISDNLVGLFPFVIRAVSPT